MPDDVIRVVVDPDLIDLVPGYLIRRQEDVVTLSDAVRSGDLQTVRSIGHSLKGSGGGYGFDGITDIGALLERAGAAEDSAAASSALAMLADYLDRVVVAHE
jgi:hypothetical protein